MIQEPITDQHGEAPSLIKHAKALDTSALFSALDALFGAVSGLHDLAEETYNRHDSRLIGVREALTRAQDIIADSFL